MDPLHILYFFLHLTPRNYYLLINFIDIAYNNFDLHENPLPHFTIKYEHYLFLTIRILNVTLMCLGIIAYFVYLIMDNFQLFFHVLYAQVRLVLILIRFTLFLSALLMYIFLLAF